MPIGKNILKQGTMFGEPKYEKYADIVSLVSPEEARKSSEILLCEFKGASKAKKRRIKKVTVNAMNRAFATLKREHLSDKERREFATIGNIYKITARKMQL